MAKLTSSFSRTKSSSFPENISSSFFFWLNFRNLMLAKPRAVRSVTPTRRRYENTSRPFTAPVRKNKKRVLSRFFLGAKMLRQTLMGIAADAAAVAEI